MKVFGFSRNGFLYIDNGNSLISQQVTSSESEMLNRYSSEWEYKNYDDALATFNHHKPKPISKKDVIDNEIHNSNIGKRFQEDIIDNLDDYDDYDGSYESYHM
tara:strand:- start:283 stop:591 length:309 start_codon:yes stop_codon:yes gene_type:complete